MRRQPRIEIKESVSPVSGAQRWYWRIIASNGEIVAASETYTSQSNAVRGAKAARRAARVAKITIATLVAGLTLLAGTASAAPKKEVGIWHRVCPYRVLYRAIPGTVLPPYYFCHMVKVLPTRRGR
jgi:uncharacterized protein YegP (UPF0339 family)